jgi:hypothetical protein
MANHIKLFILVLTLIADDRSLAAIKSETFNDIPKVSLRSFQKLVVLEVEPDIG